MFIYYVTVRSTSKFLLCLPATILHAIVCISCPDHNYMARAKNGWCRSRTFQIFLAKHFKWSLYRMTWKQQSNLAHHQWYRLWNREFEQLLKLYGYALQFQDTLQRGWLKHSNRVQIALACRHSRHRVSCIHAARVAARHCVCCHPWLLLLAAYCRHSFCMCNAQLGFPHNAVHSSSSTVWGEYPGV